MSDTTVTPYVDTSTPETLLEKNVNFAFGIAFLVIVVVSALRMRNTPPVAAAAETTVVTAFYSLICATATIRAVYFLIPSTVWQPAYTPTALEAHEDAGWFSYMLAECTVTLGSLTLFSIFILILVYWADILQKYYNPGARRTVPMHTFGYLTSALALAALLNVVLFFLGVYTTEGMVLGNALLLSATSLVCVTEITIFSRKFQNVLQTLGAINQVSTESQVKRIVWITVTGNVFFVSRALLEMFFCALLLVTWYQTGSVQRSFAHVTWDIFCVCKYGAEVMILSLMLHILQSRFNSSSSSNGGGSTNGTYQKVPEAETSGGGGGVVV